MGQSGYRNRDRVPCFTISFPIIFIQNFFPQSYAFRCDLGQFILVLDPTAIGGDAALSRFGALTATMSEEPGVRIPGQRGLSARRKAASEGIVIEDDVMAMIEGV